MNPSNPAPGQQPTPQREQPGHAAPQVAPGFKFKKWLWVGGVTLAVGVLAAVSMQPQPVAVDTAAIQRGPLSVSVDAQGRTQAKLRYTVGAPIGGRLMRTALREGDRIEEGDVLARIAPPPTDARTAATARAEVLAAQARERQAAAARNEAASHLRLANSELKRRGDLFTQGFIGAEALEAYAQAAQAAAARLEVARATLAAAGADVQSARARQLGAGTATGLGAAEGTIEVRAPVSGVVLKVHEESERVVAAGSALFDLSQGQALELVVDVLTQDAVQVQPGNPIRVTGWGGPQALQGRVRQINPGAFTKVSTLGVEEQRVNVLGDLVNAPPELGTGYRVEAGIVTWSSDDVLRVPTGALFRRAGAWHVFVAEAGQARLRTLDIDHQNTHFAEVTSGLKEGDRVVLFPSGMVADGVPVEPN